MNKLVLTFIAILFCLSFFKSADAQTTPIYSYYNTVNHKHFYTCNPNEITVGQNGWTVDNSSNLGYLATITTNAPVYRFYQSSSGAHYYTLNRNVYPNGFVYEGIMDYGPSSPFNFQRQAVYEYYNAGDYYYSTNGNGVQGYHLNGIAYYSIP